MNLNLLILQFISHLLADFIFQSNKWAQKKKKFTFHYVYIYHIAIVIILSYVLSMQKNFLLYSVIIGISHLVIDISKTFFSKKIKNFDFFFIDQLLHLIIIVFIVYFYSKFNEINFFFKINTRFLAIIAGFIFCYSPSNILIKHILYKFKIKIPEDTDKEKNNNDLPEVGKLIGITERFIVLILIISGNISIIGFILAAKSILRINDIKKSEYILAGTLLSFAIAIFVGLLINLF